MHDVLFQSVMRMTDYIYIYSAELQEVPKCQLRPIYLPIEVTQSRGVSEPLCKRIAIDLQLCDLQRLHEGIIC